MACKVFFLVFVRLVAVTLAFEADDPTECKIDDEPRSLSRVIAPGTKWCGDGDIAKDENDFGYFTDVDKCCKQHDKCDRCIPGYSTAYGLYNPEPYSRCHCNCDKEFYECLMTSSGRMSRTIKEIYFTILSKKCFQEKPASPGAPLGTVEYEFVDEYGWRPIWDKVAGAFMSVALMKDHQETDRYAEFEDPIEIPWFCE